MKTKHPSNCAHPSAVSKDEASRPGKLDLALARVCLGCPVCRRARRKQRGMAFLLTSKVESHLCPFCKAYKRVYGRMAHERC